MDVKKMRKFIFRYLMMNGQMVFEIIEAKNSSEAFKTTLDKLNQKKSFKISNGEYHYTVDPKQVMHMEFENYIN